MIQKNELRVGNKVFNVDNDIVTVIEIRDEFYLIESGSGQYYKTSNGIELSPEILERCGFVADHVSHYGGWLIKVNNDEQIRIVWDENIGWHWPMNGHNKPIVKYLHQLQNLYYCLCGEELTFKQ